MPLPRQRSGALVMMQGGCCPADELRRRRLDKKWQCSDAAERRNQYERSGDAKVDPGQPPDLIVLQAHVCVCVLFISHL